jgi:uroporphyrinogen-III decarboxylase
MLVQRSMSSMGPVWEASHMVGVQRSSSSATVVAKAVKRSESMHVRMKQLVEAAKVLKQTQHGGEDAIIIRYVVDVLL